MNPFLGPLDADGRVPASQQTRVAAFLMSAHGALARQLMTALPGRLREGWQVELHIQYCRELELLTLLAGATTWVPDPALPFQFWHWELAWMPQPAEGAQDSRQGRLIDLAAFGHALHAVIRPAALLPENAPPMEPFAVALRRIEFEAGRLMQAHILFLKGPQFESARDVVSAAVEKRHAQVRELWNDMLAGIDIDTRTRHVGDTAYHSVATAAQQGR
jgi:hypothetical protein